MTCPAAVGGQAEQRSARVKRGEGGTVQVSSRSRRFPRGAEQIGAQWSTTVKWIDCYPTHTDERGNSWRTEEERGGCVWMARRRSHQSEWMSRGWTCSPFRGWPNIKLICSITPEQLLGMSICRTLNWGWICHVTKKSDRIRQTGIYTV